MSDFQRACARNPARRAAGRIVPGAARDLDNCLMFNANQD
jgi:hypothetical protein